MYTENTAYIKGACQEANTVQGKAECCICFETLTQVFVHKSKDCTFSDYILPVGQVIFSSIQTAMIFGDQAISI